MTTSLLSSSTTSWVFLKKLATRWLMSVRTVSISGKILLTAMMLWRRDTRPDPKEAALAEARCLNPHPGTVKDGCPALIR